jgi:transcriptional regulator with XRE-family HTH domain
VTLTPLITDAFRANLRRLRERAKISQEVLGKAGFTTPISGLLERGEHELRLSTVVLLARAIAVSFPTRLRDGETAPPRAREREPAAGRTHGRSSACRNADDGAGELSPAADPLPDALGDMSSKAARA